MLVLIPGISSKMASDQFSSNFKELASRFSCISASNEEAYSIVPLFGYWYNLCINAPRFSWNSGGKGVIEDVICTPHIDAENWAIYMCCIFVYSLEGNLLQQVISMICNLIP
jgi:hypothetical protein